MYIGTLANFDPTVLPKTEALEKIIAFLRDFEFSRLVEGEDYPIDGENIFARIQKYTTKPAAECPPEKHERYADVVYMVKGTECIGWCHYAPDLKIVKEYDAKTDVAFFEKIIPPSYMVVEKDSLFIISPSEVHCPCIRHEEPSEVVKVVVKADAKLLGLA